MPFREDRRLKAPERGGLLRTTTGTRGLRPSGAVGLADLLWAVESLRGEIRTFTRKARTTLETVRADSLNAGPVSAAPSPAGTPEDKDPAAGSARLQAERDRLAAERDQALLERDQARAERDALAGEIAIIKRELSFLMSRTDEDDRLTLAGNELRAVVETTEDATNVILGTCEQILDLTRQIAGLTKSPAIARHVSGLDALVVALMEACNFQDLTGQRINKVVRTLRFLDEHIRTMVDLFGEDALPEPETDGTAPLPEDDESHLLNGPQDKERSISQAEIDALFG